MKKKLLALLVCATMVLCAACGSSDSSEKSTTSKKNNNKVTTVDKNNSKDDDDDDEETTKSKSDSEGDELILDEYDFEGKIYKGKGYSIKYPSNWTVGDGSSINADFLMYCNDTANDGFNENVNVMLQDVSSYEDMDLEAYTDLSLKQYEQLDATILQKSPMTLNGIEGYFLMLQMESSGVEANLTQYFTIRDDIAYIFTFTGDDEGYDKLMGTDTGSDIGKILSSFTID